jgi:hypothetical protein
MSAAKSGLWSSDGLASLIARVIATRNMFLAGRDDSIDAMASRLGVRRDYVAVLLWFESCLFSHITY